jgi:hypothetical protein
MPIEKITSLVRWKVAKIEFEAQKERRRVVRIKDLGQLRQMEKAQKIKDCLVLLTKAKSAMKIQNSLKRKQESAITGMSKLAQGL